MTVRRYRKRPLPVSAIQWTGDNADEVIAFTGAENFRTIPPEQQVGAPGITASVYDRLHATWIGTYTGQHIVQGVLGEYHPIDEDAIAATYDLADDDPSFFQVGHTYGRMHHGARIRFEVTSVETSPDGSHYRVAFGWRTTDDSLLASPDHEDDLDGWVDITSEVA